MGGSVLRGEREKKQRAEKLRFWQERLDKALKAYAEELAEMDRREGCYNGDRSVGPDPNTGQSARRLSSNVRNIVYELIESQVDPTIPLPRVEAVHQEDRPLAKKIEALLRSRITSGRLGALNDLQERTVPIQGGSFWQVEWDPAAGGHCVLGDVTVTDRHPRQVIPQPGVYEIEKMDYLFLRLPQTRAFLKRRYGVEVTDGEEDPGLRGPGQGPEEDLVTQNIAYYRDEEGDIGLFSWAGDTLLEDLPGCQGRMRRVCAACGREESGPVCPCGGKKFIRQSLESQELPEDFRAYLGDFGPWGPEEEVPLLDKDGLPVLGQEGQPLTQSRRRRLRAPVYRPGLYPLVLRPNIRKYGSLLGVSDAAVIRDQQDTVKKLGAKIDEKILKGGSYVTLPQGVNVETTERELKIIRLRTPAEKQLIDVLNIQPDVTKERLALEDNYSWAKSTLGITDAFQGKYDSSAISGTAKQFSANQSAGRLQSKREMKNLAYAELYRMIFRSWLAWADQPLPYSWRNEEGQLTYDHFDRWEFLRRDAAGQLYWDDEFIFTVDPSATLSSNREALWQQIAQNYQSGAFGPLDKTGTQVLLWRLYEWTNYPYAGQIRQALEARQREEALAAGGMNALTGEDTAGLTGRNLAGLAGGQAGTLAAGQESAPEGAGDGGALLTGAAPEGLTQGAGADILALLRALGEGGERDALPPM